jgi:hypothetical protein
VRDVGRNAAKAIDGLRPSFSSHVRLGECGAPVDSLLRCLALRIADLERWYPTSREKQARYGAPPRVGDKDRPQRIAQEFVEGSYNAGGFGCIIEIVRDFRNSPGKRRFAFLLPLGLLMLSMAVFGWGLQYKLSLYQAKDSISHLTPEAKLLSQKERPVATQAMDVRPSELPAFPLLPALLMAALTPGLYQAAARYVRTASTEGSRAPLPPCLQAVFLRPPPVLS